MISKEVAFSLGKVFNLDLNSDYIFIKDSNFNYIYANDALLSLFNTTLDIVLGKNDLCFMDEVEICLKCEESDIIALEKGYSSSIEKVFDKEYEVLKFKINLNNDEVGILSWVRPLK